jgi:hypothetical protein
MPEGKPTVSKIPGQSIGPQFSEEGMATFKVGQRVKVVSCIPGNEIWIGWETTIAGLPGSVASFPLWYELSSGPVPKDADQKYIASANSLAPLINPGADAFIERIKRICREPINDAPKVTVSK